MPSSWIYNALDLRRPQYPKQPEVFLIDLLWNSIGSTLSNDAQLDGPQDLKNIVYMSYSDKEGGPKTSRSFASNTDVSSLFSFDEEVDVVAPFLDAIVAPKSGLAKYNAAVPILPEMVLFQTLRGISGLPNPVNIAAIAENMAILGGATKRGELAQTYLDCVLGYLNEIPTNSSYIDFDILIKDLTAKTSSHAWSQYGDEMGGTPIVKGQDDLPIALSMFADTTYKTPFKWFWKTWKNLTNSENKWLNSMTMRRWTDWALCVLRTMMFLGYVWELQFYVHLHKLLSAHKSANKDLTDKCFEQLRRFLTSEDYVLVDILDPGLPATQKDHTRALKSLVCSGSDALEQVDGVLSSEPPDTEGLLSKIELLLELPSSDFSDLSDLDYSEVVKGAKKNRFEFLKYTSLSRGSNSDIGDQSDLYYLARNNTRSMWFEPGPEWIVVVASLTTLGPGRQCTLKELEDNLRMMGVRIRRGLLVDMLGSHGLTTDSPDADEAILIQSGF